MLFRDEDSVAGYLGVHMDWCEDGTIHLTQLGLAGCIVEAMHMNDKAVIPWIFSVLNFYPLTNMAVLLMENSAILPLLDSSTIYRDIHVQISRWQLLNVLDMFIIQNSITN